MSEQSERTIQDTLEELGGGEVLSALDAELQSVVRAVRDTRRQGTVSVSLKIKPNGQEAVMIEVKVDGKPPIKALPETTFFARQSGELLNRPPEQQDMLSQARDVPDDSRNRIRSVS